jgi:hypothetical protein
VSDETTDRRRFLVLGAAGGAAAILAACGKKSSSAGGESATTTTTIPSADDVKLLRTASSLEALEVAIYQKAIDGGVVKTPAALATIKTLQAQHKEHTALFAGHTTRLGGTALTDANPALLAQLQSRLNGADEAGLLRLAFDVAQMTTATYQAAVGNVKDNRLNLILMSVAGVEARHAALLGTMTGQSVPAGSLSTTEKAIAPGTGV